MNEKEIIKNIKELAKKLGKTPSITSYRKEFGNSSDFYKINYNYFVIKAGLKPNSAHNQDEKRKKKNHLEKKKELKKKFLALCDRLQFVPTRDEMDECGISSEVIRYYFGSFKSFLNEIGLTTRTKNFKSENMAVLENFDREIILNKIRDLTKRIKRIPTIKEYESEYGKVKNIKKYGNFSSLIELANPILPEDEISKVQLEDIYFAYIKKNGIPSVRSLPEELPSLKVIRKYFKNFEALLNEIGYDKQQRAFYKMSSEEMIIFLQDSVDRKILKTPKDLNLNYNLPFWETVKYVLKCESFEEMADIIDRQELNEIRYNKYTRKEIAILYRKLSEKLDKKETGATLRELDFHYRINSFYISELFGGINDLRAELGYKTEENIEPVFEKDVLIKILKRKIKAKRRNLKIKEINEDPELPSILTLYKIFGVNKIKDLYEKLYEE